MATMLFSTFWVGVILGLSFGGWTKQSSHNCGFLLLQSTGNRKISRGSWRQSEVKYCSSLNTNLRRMWWRSASPTPLGPKEPSLSTR